MPASYVSLYLPDHPLATADGKVLQHRMALYDAIGPGEHTCHWCGTPVIWQRREKSAPFRGILVVDHLDADGLNNSLDNLVPSCQRCNRLRTDHNVIRAHELFIITPNGARHRATECTCRHCGKSFLAKTSSLKYGKGVYCSRSCHYASERAKRNDCCSRGHPRTTENTFIAANGSRGCRVCARAATERYRERAKKMSDESHEFSFSAAESGAT